MPSNWETCTWGDLATLEYGKGLRGYESGSGSVRVYGTNGPIGWTDEPLCRHPTVVVGRKGAYRGVHYSPEQCYVIDTAFYLSPKKPFDMRWAYYELLTKDINSMDSGSAIPSTSRDDFYSLPVLLPPEPLQKAIAHILGTLDDKIELNRRKAETLEAMARALFKSWFVDFDPVHARSQDDNEGIPQHIHNLFPKEFEDSILGKIPKGWRTTSIQEALVIHDAKRVPLSSRQRAERKGQYPYYGAASVMDYVDDYLFDGVYVLLGEDGSVVNDDGSPVLQYVSGKFWVNNHAHVLSGNNGITAEYLLLFLERVNIRPYVTGAVQAKLNQGNLLRIPFLFPSGDILAYFNQIVEPNYAKIRQLREENASLRTVQQLLLPRLISGELSSGIAI